MKPIAKTPLEDWIRDRIGLDPERTLTREAIDQWQLNRLRQTVAYVQANSPFYRRHLAGHGPERIAGLADIASLPFTTAEDIRHDPMAFVCVSAGAVARAVTLPTSGTTAAAKRVFFSDDDLETTIDFFHHGMKAVVAPGQRVLIGMPGTLPASVGDLLVKALARMAVTGHVHGPIADPALAVDRIRDLGIDAIVGLPVQVLKLACHPESARLPAGRIKTVLLTADAVPDAVVARIQKVWACEVFAHYGMTETGYGGGVDCQAHAGYHLREADLLYEIIDPQTLVPIPEGVPGEVVVTTLTRRAMPLVRYRTGDSAAWICGPCPCGTVLKRLSRVAGRLEQRIHLGRGLSFTALDLDEALFAIDGLHNYRAELGMDKGRQCLQLAIHAPVCETAPILALARSAASRVQGIAAAIEAGAIQIECVKADADLFPAVSGMVKRKVTDCRSTKG